jgi:hypothetical protein
MDAGGLELMKRLLLVLVIFLFATAGHSLLVLQSPLGLPQNSGTGWASPSAGNCKCHLFNALAMAEVSDVRLYVGTAGSAGTAEIGIYSYDGNTLYFDSGATNFDVSSTGYQTITNTAGTVAVPEGNFWICFSADSSTTGYQMSSSNVSGAESVTNYQATVTCTSGNIPATISPSGAFSTDDQPAVTIVDF